MPNTKIDTEYRYRIKDKDYSYTTSDIVELQNDVKKNLIENAAAVILCEGQSAGSNMQNSDGLLHLIHLSIQGHDNYKYDNLDNELEFSEYDDNMLMWAKILRDDVEFLKSVCNGIINELKINKAELSDAQRRILDVEKTPEEHFKNRSFWTKFVEACRGTTDAKILSDVYKASLKQTKEGTEELTSSASSIKLNT